MKIQPGYGNQTKQATNYDTSKHIFYANLTCIHPQGNFSICQIVQCSSCLFILTTKSELHPTVFHWQTGSILNIGHISLHVMYSRVCSTIQAHKFQDTKTFISLGTKPHKARSVTQTDKSQYTHVIMTMEVVIVTAMILALFSGLHWMEWKQTNWRHVLSGCLTTKYSGCNKDQYRSVTEE